MNEIRDIHDPFVAWLRKIGIPYHRNRSDKRTTAIKGDPDFLIMWMGHGLYIECKAPGNRLSADQEERIAYIRRAGNKVVLAYSLQDCLEACRDILCIDGDLTSGGEKPDTRESIATDPSTDHPTDAKPCVRTGSGVPAGQMLFIGKIHGTDYVLRGDNRPGGECELVRRATAADKLTIP